MLKSRLRSRPRAKVVIVDPERHTTMAPDGAVRSVQAADVTLPSERLQEIWTPVYMERLARTYWRFITRISLGLLRMSYSPSDRAVVFIRRPLVLLRFQAPEYELSAERAVVRWPIKDGVLVSAKGRNGKGYLEIEAERRTATQVGTGVVHVEVEVANFYPAIASGISTWAYNITQSKIHVLVTHGFLRSLARMKLAYSRVGKFTD